jgi:hypothetical protein
VISSNYLALDTTCNRGSFDIVRPSRGSSPPAAATTAHTAAATAPRAEMATPTVATSTVGCPRRCGALPACRAAIAIPTHLAAIANALERLRLSVALGALAVLCAKLPVLLPAARASCLTGSQSFAATCSRAAPIGVASSAFHPAPLEIAPDALRATVR